MSNMENQKPSFDLFGKPDTDDLKEHLEKGTYQWTNKYTKFLAGAVVVVGLLSVGAWYGHHSATSTSTASLNGFNAFRSQFGNGTGRTNGGTQSAGGFSGGNFGGGGFGGVRVTGTISKVSGDQVTVKLDDPTQAASLKSGDSARVTDTGASSFGQQSAPQNSTSNKSSTNNQSSKSSASSKPSIGSNGGGQRRGFFSDPKVQACLKENGVTLTPGVRPDRNDPKVIAAFTKCLPNFGK